MTVRLARKNYSGVGRRGLSCAEMSGDSNFYLTGNWFDIC